MYLVTLGGGDNPSPMPGPGGLEQGSKPCPGSYIYDNYGGNRCDFITPHFTHTHTYCNAWHTTHTL